MTSSNKNGGWLVDSGATSHVTNNKNLLTTIDGMYKSNVNLANGTKTGVAGKGSCKINVQNDSGDVSIATITDVLYAPDIDGNMLSVKKLLSKGFTVIFDQKLSEIRHGGKQVAVMDEVDDLFKVRNQMQFVQFLKKYQVMRTVFIIGIGFLDIVIQKPSRKCAERN